jgi:hypothetical protein
VRIGDVEIVAGVTLRHARNSPMSCATAAR